MRRLSLPSNRPRRSGLVLIIVTVLLLLISLGAIGLVSLVQTEYRASRIRGDELELENTAAAGRDYLAALAAQSRAQQAAVGGLRGNRERFAHQRLVTDKSELDASYFTITPPGDPGTGEPREAGPVNESGKLHLQLVLLWEEAQPGSGAQALQALPGMTSDLADRILDWIDADSVPRSSGLEGDGYAAQGRSYRPRNAVPPVLDELLLIPGVTPELLWGYPLTTMPAATGRGPARSGGNRTRKAADGFRGSRGGSRPWRNFLTVCSGERNENYQGQARIDLNRRDLVDLHQLLSLRLGVQWANFVVAYRQYGPARGRRGTTVTSFQPDLNVAASYEFPSELELIGTRAALPSDNRTPKSIVSPLQPEQSGWQGELSRVLDEVTIISQPVIPGRIDIESAPREVLLAIPGLDVVVVDQMLASRAFASDAAQVHRHPAWLVEQGIMSLERLAPVLPNLTTRGDVWSAELRAGFEGRRPSIRDEFMVDATVSPPRQLYCKDLRDLPDEPSVDGRTRGNRSPETSPPHGSQRQ